MDSLHNVLVPILVQMTAGSPLYEIVSSSNGQPRLLYPSQNQTFYLHSL